MTFPARLTELLEKADSANKMATMAWWGSVEQTQLRMFICGHAEAIRDLVVAVSEEHGGNHHEPECPICVALAKFNDAGEK